jgi:hypothetical protein
MNKTWAFIIGGGIIAVLAINRRTQKIGYALIAIVLLVWGLRWAQGKMK